METLQTAQQFFNKEIRNLQERQHMTEKDVNDLKINHESLSVNYKTTFKQLEALENKVAKLSIENQEIPYLFMLPDRTEWFSGRVPELQRLHSLFQDVNNHKVKIASVCGLGGSGKTSLAAEYAHRWKDVYDGGVFWFSGEDETKFANSVDDHAVYLGTLLQASPGKTLLKTLEVISKIQKPWLLVLDDMDEFKLSSNIGMLLSGPWKRGVKGCGHILITTRRKPKVMSETIRGFKESQCLQLECFSIEDGKLFVFKRTGISSDEETSTEAANLVETLGALPLALEQACAYISHLSCSLSEYLQQYKKYSLELLDEQDASSASLYGTRDRLAVRTTWIVNFEFVSQSKYGDFAVRFLHACAFFNPTEIYQELINPGKPPIEDDAYRDYVDTPLGSSRILKLLSDFSLFRKNKGSSLTVHRLVQEVIRENLKSDDEEVLSLLDAIRMLSFAFSKCPSPDDLLTSGIVSPDHRTSTLATNPSLFYFWKKLCQHAQEILTILKSFQILDERILMPETARIVYECALDFNIRSKTDQAAELVVFAHKIIDLGSTRLTKSDQDVLFPHEMPLPEPVRRYVFYSCAAPHDTADSSTSDSNKRIGSKSKMEQMHAQGNSYFSSGNFQKAVELYSAAMAEVSFFDLKILCDRALAYINLQQYKNALADSVKYLSQRPKSWLGFAIKALALHGLNEIWEASCSAALAFYYNRSIFSEYQPFKETFSTLERRVYICQCSTLLANFLFKPISDSRAASDFPGKIIMIEPGDYVVNIDHYPMTSPFLIFRFPTFTLLIDDCILLGLDNLKSKVVVRFNEFVAICGPHVMAANVSFVFTLGNWESQSCSVTTWLNCAFSSSLKQSKYTFLSLGADTFRNCSFENSKSPGLTVMGKTDVVMGKAVVEKCVFSGGEYSGVHVATGGHLEIKESKLCGNHHGMYITCAIGACNISNCDIFDNKCYGIIVIDNALNVSVENCRIFQNDYHGISVENASSALVTNSHIFENGWNGIGTVCDGRCTVSHNKIYCNKFGGVQVVPVDRRKRMSPSIVEFNEIFDNRGHGIDSEMKNRDTPSDTCLSSMSKHNNEQAMHYRQNVKHFEKAKCNGNNCYNNESTLSSTVSVDSKINAELCSYCRKKCSSNCGKCFVTFYCDKKCQSSDWKKHKKECLSILERSTIRINISKSDKLSRNVEHLMIVPTIIPRLPGLAPKGPKHANIPNFGERFLVKILAANEAFYEDVAGPILTICDRSLTINGSLDKKRYPQLHNIVRECGVNSIWMEGWKKKFFWAQFQDESCTNLRLFKTKFPELRDW